MYVRSIIILLWFNVLALVRPMGSSILHYERRASALHVEVTGRISSDGHDDFISPHHH